MSVSDHLFKLRSQMAIMGIDACIITSADPHLSEYPADHWKFREWISGFTGSAGTVVITTEDAGLWTDSRYYLQAENELDTSDIHLFRMGENTTPDYKEWLIKSLHKGAVVGVNGKTLSVDELRLLKQKLNKNDIRLDAKLTIEEDIWIGRTPIPDDVIYEYDTKYSGLSRLEKIDIIRNEMKKNNVTHYIVPALDEIAWVLNLRGKDVEYNPVFHAYLIISQNQISLFIDPHKLTSAIGKKLSADGVKVFLYTNFYQFINELPSLATVWIDPQRCNGYIFNCLPDHSTKFEKMSIITHLKGCKNETEIENIKTALVKDGVAIVKFLFWLSKHINTDSINEHSAAEKLGQFRRELDNFHGDSFNTISAYGPNAAIPHYSVKEKTALPLKPKGLYLVDSGGQYFDGTTDITRTVALGKLTDEEKKDYTLVLKGHIALALAVFPKGTRGVHLDILARQAMWKDGINFGHGTGHGVGHFLNVHEGPQSIRPQDNGVNLEIGMITSNEPGIYRSGKHGIRIENLILTVLDQKTDFGEFMKFETLTLCPIDTTPIDAQLLNEIEKEWLNKYHEKVYETLSPHLTEDEIIWLKEKTKII